MMRMWAADGEKGLILAENGKNSLMGPPCQALCLWRDRIFAAGADHCFCCHRETGEKLLHFAVPTGVCALAAQRGKIYALSADADSITAYSAQTGEPLFSAPAGSYPRGLCLDAQSGCLAVAGGAAGEAIVLDENLRRVAQYRLPGAVCGVCFLPRGMAALCAVEQGDLAARLVTVSFRGVTDEVFSRSLVPSCLCALSGGSCAVGCCGEVAVIRPNKKTAFRRGFPCPVRIRPAGRGILVCDAWQGSASLLPGGAIYQGGDPQDALLT